MSRTLVIVDPDLPHQAGTWGLLNVEFELISFLPSKAHLNLEKFKKIVKSSDFEYYEFTTHNCWHNLTYPSERVLPYLTNILVTFPKNTTITYIGFNSYISNSTEKLLLDLEMNFFSFIGEQLLYQTNTLINDFYPKSNVLIFDFGFDLNHNDPQYHRFLKIASLFNNLVVRNSKESQNDLFKRKYFIAINTRENIFASLTELLIQFNQTPVGTFCIGGFPLQNINNPEIVELRKKELLQLENYFIAPLLHKDSFYYNLRDYELKTSNNCSKTPILYMGSFYFTSKREHLETLKKHSRIPIIYKDPSYYQYQLNQIIDFTKPYNRNINAGLDHNWSNISSNGIWTIGKNANMRLKLNKQLEQNLKIRIQLKPFTRPFYENQTLEVFVNNRSINKWEFKHTPVFFNKIKPNVWVEAIVPKTFVSNNKLKLSYKSSFTSKETDFGIRIQKILLSEINLNANKL